MGIKNIAGEIDVSGGGHDDVSVRSRIGDDPAADRLDEAGGYQSEGASPDRRYRPSKGR